MSIKVGHIKIGEGQTKVCVPIVGESYEEIGELTSKVRDCGCDIIEWRADWFEDYRNIDHILQVLEMMRERIIDMPLIFTMRTMGEGGKADLTYEEYEEILLDVARSGLADMIDVECFIDERVSELNEKLKEEGAIVVGSYHDFEKTDSTEELKDRMRKIVGKNSDIVKIAVMPNTKDDVVNLLNATFDMTKETDKPLITMSMGKLGALSRISGNIFGSSVTFGNYVTASAPGQIGVIKLEDILKTI
ncbi:MAG: type I 3-dehydroquinate dehydratase [Lachnospiraceae bacterium]|nr:type I 3-dehydroquinate dehydratase [Lachnospiraceae bacterium]